MVLSHRQTLCWWLQCHTTLRWRHNGRDSISNHQPYDCLLNRLFRRRSKKTSNFRVTGLCAGNSPGTGEFPAQMASNAENVSIWWRHHDIFFPVLSIRPPDDVIQNGRRDSDKSRGTDQRKNDKSCDAYSSTSLNSLRPSDAYMCHQPRSSLVQPLSEPMPSYYQFAHGNTFHLKLKKKSFKKMHLKMSPEIYGTFCLGQNVLKQMTYLKNPAMISGIFKTYSETLSEFETLCHQDRRHKKIRGNQLRHPIFYVMGCRLIGTEPRSNQVIK